MIFFQSSWVLLRIRWREGAVAKRGWEQWLFPVSMGPSIDVWPSPLRVCSRCRITSKQMLGCLDYQTCLKLDSSRYFAPFLKHLCSLSPLLQPSASFPAKNKTTLCMERRQKGKKKKCFSNVFQLLSVLKLTQSLIAHYLTYLTLSVFLSFSLSFSKSFLMCDLHCSATS